MGMFSVRLITEVLPRLLIPAVVILVAMVVIKRFGR